MGQKVPIVPTDFSGTPPTGEEIFKLILKYRNKVGPNKYVRYLGRELPLDNPNLSCFRKIFSRCPSAQGFRGEVMGLLQHLGFCCTPGKTGVKNIAGDDFQRILAFLQEDCRNVWEDGIQGNQELEQGFTCGAYANGAYGGALPALLDELQETLHLPVNREPQEERAEPLLPLEPSDVSPGLAGPPPTASNGRYYLPLGPARRRRRQKKRGRDGDGALPYPAKSNNTNKKK